MSTHTTTSVYTRTHTAVYLTEAILSTITGILAQLDIDASRLLRDWEQDSKAISAWITEGSLAMVIVECTRPDGTVNPVFEFPVTYTSGREGDAQFVTSQAAIARYRAKFATTPRGTTFRLFCTFCTARTPQPGWSEGTRASIDGLRSTSFGTVAEGPHARASGRYLSS
ncbi:MAG TPA: hypothetical protein VGO39_14570 [Gaiellaceae bacterium]|jgi:hypothetical protein|nr:hypothetical protein [Gaiellaceae bacterium]